MKCTLTQISNIIKNNPNKALVESGRQTADTLMLNIYGHKLSESIKQQDYFENPDIFSVRKSCAISNKDLFGRLLQREDMVFAAQGGATFFEGPSKDQINELNANLDKVRFGMNLRKWVKSFALQAYRSDPMSVMFLEIDIEGQKCYPTYKSTFDIYDYLPNGRGLEYICFKLTVADAISFNVEDIAFKDMKQSDDSGYFRFVDDSADYIFKLSNGLVSQYSSLPNPWEQTPGFITSDLISFNNPSKFLSPLHQVMELAGQYLNDRSIRDLSKKFSGFPKSYEPLIDCGTCDGTGFLSSSACPDCTPAGSDRGTGKKLRTKPADVMRFPLNTLENAGFDVKKIAGYISPPIEVWDKQDTSLNDIENMMRDVYWGTDNRQTTTGPNVGATSIEESATKTLANLQPIYNRLNQTADWAEKTENAVADFIGRFLFPGAFKKSAITYGRYYILETPAELMEQYLSMKAKGASQFALFDALKKYYHSVYSTNPTQLAIKMKLINVEPFVHYTVAQIQASNPAQIDFLMKLYFSEWLATKTDEYLLATNEAALIQDLTTYAAPKAALIPENQVQAGTSVSETVKSTN